VAHIVTPALVAVLVVSLASNVWVHLGPRHAQLVTGSVGAVVLVGIGRRAGLSWAQMGLDPGLLLPGVVVGAVAGALVAAVFALALAVPWARRFLLDERYALSTRSALHEALVTIPLATVVFEETVFRGVLWGLLDADVGAAAATLVSSALFGLWHVLPALDLARTNTAARDAGAGGPRRLAAVLVVVVATTLAGLLLGELRRRTGSLAAPAVLHWAANGTAVVASARACAVNESTVTRVG
jgi:uncharacterized protein